MKICIIGEGLTSLALAKALVNLNINVEVLSFKKKQIIDPSRTLGITTSNVSYFNENIINIDKIIWKINRIEIFSEKKNKECLLEFENDKKNLFSMVRNSDLLKLLEKNLEKNKLFKIKFQNKLTNISDKYDLVFNLNFQNLITKKFFSKKITKKYNSFAYSGIFEHNKINNKIAIQIFTKIGPLAFLPISSNETSLVYSVKKNSNFRVENFLKLINFYNPKYKVKKMKKISSTELTSINLRSYYHRNILAFGDLIHKIHPLAGQGFNMTIRDIKTLISIIRNKMDLGLPLDVSVNEEFEKTIKSKNFIFSNGIDFIYEFFNLETRLDINVLSHSVKLLGKNSTLNKIFTKIADKGSIF